MPPRPQHPPHFGDGALDVGLARQVLQHVAAEDDVNRTVVEEAELVGANFVKLNVRVQHPDAVRIEVHADTPRGLHMIEKFTVPAAQVDHGVAAPDPRLKKIAYQHAPYF